MVVNGERETREFVDFSCVLVLFMENVQQPRNREKSMLQRKCIRKRSGEAKDRGRHRDDALVLLKCSTQLALFNVQLQFGLLLMAMITLNGGEGILAENSLETCQPEWSRGESHLCMK